MERRLGRGLGSLLSGSRPAPKDPSPGAKGAQEHPGGVRAIALEEIRPNPRQPRHAFDPVALEGLRKSIQAHGILQPVVVRPGQSGGFDLVAGERRWRAARLAGLKSIPALVKEGVGDEAMLELALVENVQRQDLNAMEKARGYHSLMETFAWTQRQVAEKVALERSSVANQLRLLELPEAVQVCLEEGRIGMGHARALLGLKNAEEQLALAEAAAAEGLSVREVERRVRAAGKSPVLPGARAGAVERPVWAGTMEARLRDALGTRVELVVRGPERGRIVIDYADRSTLDRLADAIAPAATI